MNVLSLFDGISCGMVALERAGIPVERYVAYEIDEYAIKVSQKNYPNIEHCGDVTNADFTQYKGFDLLIGGSPCTYWSIAKNNRETTPDGIGGQLFMQYVRALKESGCKYFLYENNYSIHKNIKNFISEQLGVQPIMINSALVSAQQRKRCYWTNIPNVKQPNDKGILLKDILESGIPYQDKSHCMTSSYNGAVLWNSLERHQRSMVAEPAYVDVPKPIRVGQIGKGGQGQRIYSVKGKSVTLSANGGGQGAKTGLYAVPYELSTEYYKGGQDGNLIGMTANGEGKYRNGNQPSQQYRVYSCEDKSQVVNTVGNENYIVPTTAKNLTPVYEVKNGFITIKNKQYPIKLADGFYIIRKLTPIEAERLQTLPDNYTEGISNTQRYKCIGNGWSVDVFAHIFKGLLKENP